MSIPVRLLFLSIVVSAHTASARVTDSVLFVSKQWGMSEGLPQSSVNDVIQTRDGYLWLATFGGLARFDGVSFTVFNRTSKPKLQSDRTLRLFETRGGDLWFTAEGGLLRKGPNNFSTYSIDDEGISYAPTMMAEDSSSRLWISANAKPYRFDGSRLIRVQVQDDPSSVARALREPGGAWIVHRHSILRTVGDSVVRIADLSNILTSNIIEVAEFPRGSGQLWLATNRDGVVRWDGGKVTRFTEQDGLPSNFILQVSVDSRGRLWVGCYNGLAQFDGRKFRVVRTIGRRYDSEFNRVFVDREKNIWVGTPANGLHRLRRPVLTPIGRADGLLEEKMLSLAHRGDGSMLFGTNCGGVYEWKNGRATYSVLNQFLNNLCIWALLEDTRGRVWVGSQSLQMFRDIRRPGILLDTTDGFRGFNVFALYEDSHRTVWVGCLNGLFGFDGKVFNELRLSDGESLTDVRALYEDRSGTLWIGTTHGLFRRTAGVVRPVPLMLHAGDSSMAASSYVRAIHEDTLGTIWIGTYGGGILRLTQDDAEPGHERFSAITEQNGLFDNVVSHLVEDEQGYFWSGSNRGISRINSEDANRVADGRLRNLHADVFSSNDGMPSAETNGGFQPSAITNSSGNVYFPTVEGVVKVATRDIVANTLPPPVYIEHIFCLGRELSLSNTIELPYDSARAEIRFTALSFIDPSKVLFRTQLEGVDASWNDMSNRRTVFYTSIPPGEHEFRVVASNNDGIWNTTGASLRITVLPPFWQTTWFLILAAIVVLAPGPWFYYRRVTQLQKEKALQEHFAERLIDSQEQERRRIASELHDGLGQQILVIKNRAELALRRVNDPKKTSEQLREIMESAVSSIADVRAISHGLRPPHLEQFGLTETISALGEQLRRSTTMEWMYYVDAVDGLIPKDKEINLYRILQEATNNVLRHSGAAQASMVIRQEGDRLNVSLWDDGKGFDVEAKTASGGLGMSGIKERVKTLGGTINIRSGPNEGTVIHILIPVRGNG